MSWGREHQNLEGIEAIGVDEIAWQRVDLRRIVRKKSRYIVRLETYQSQKQPTNFSEEAPKTQARLKTGLPILLEPLHLSRIPVGLSVTTKLDHSFIIASSTPSAPPATCVPIVPMAGSSFTMSFDEFILL